MAKHNHIPEQDLQLARDVGLVQQEGFGSYLAMDDPLIRQIVLHKKHIHHLYKNELYTSKTVCWSKIEAVIKNDSDKDSQSTSVARITNLFSSRRTALKVAAIFILAALLSVFSYQFTMDQPELIAQTDSELIIQTLSDGSAVQLRPHSTLYAVENGSSEVRYKLEGEAFFNITKRENQRFVVEAGAGLIEVMGTSFNVREWDDETVVFLQEGSVLLSAADGSREIILEPGEVSSVSDTYRITDPVKTDGTEYTSWQNKELVFNNRTAGSIFKELEHHYSIEIIAPEHIKSEILGGSLSLESKSVSLSNLELVLGGKFSSIGDDTYQFVD